MLELEPKRRLSWIFTIKDAGQVVGEVDLGWGQEITPLPISGEPDEVDTDIYRKVCFILLQRGQVLAKVRKTGGLLANRFTVVYRDKEYGMKPLGVFRRGFRIIEDGVEIGKIEPQGVMTHAARSLLPQSLPLALRVFLVDGKHHYSFL